MSITRPLPITLFGEFKQTLKNLAIFPFIGRERSSLFTGLRGLIVGGHLVFYLVGSDTITIVRVIDGRMDVEEEFQR